MAPGTVSFSNPSQGFGTPAAQPLAFGLGSGSAQSSVFSSVTAASQPSLFGATPAAASQPSLFGAASQQPSQPSLFGGTSSFGAASQSSLFGATPTGATQSSLFGTPAAQPVGGASATPSLFGGAPAAGSQPSLFGATATPSSFGAAATHSAFGAAGVGSAFGGTGAQQQQFQQPQQQNAQLSAQQQQLQQQVMQQHTLGVALPVRLNGLIQKLDPRHSDSPFHTALYNVVSRADVARYQRPPDMLEKVFDEAVAKNPDPSNLVAVQANGFDDLVRRAEMQEARLKEHMAILVAIEGAVSRIEDSVTTEVDTRLALYRRRHRELARKVLMLACRVERKACAHDTDPSMSDAEVGQRRRLDALVRALAAPAEFKDKLNDLVELAGATRAERARAAGGAAAARDQRSARVVRDLLQEQLSGITHLGEVCRHADRHLAILEADTRR